MQSQPPTKKSSFILFTFSLLVARWVINSFEKKKKKRRFLTRKLIIIKKKNLNTVVASLFVMDHIVTVHYIMMMFGDVPYICRLSAVHPCICALLLFSTFLPNAFESIDKYTLYKYIF